MNQHSIALQLRIETENFAADLQTHHPLMHAAVGGSVQPETFMRYMSGLLYLIQNTCLHLELAAQVSSERGLHPLASFLRTKSRQEAGHDKWAEQDLAVLAQRFDLEPPNIPNSMIELVKYNETTARLNPRHYLAYTFFAELLTVLVGEPWMLALRKHCGIPKSALTTIAKHVDLDKLHVAEAMAELDQLLVQVTEAESLLASLRGAMRCLQDFFDEVYSMQLTPRLAG